MWSLTSYDWKHHSAAYLIERLGEVAKTEPRKFGRRERKPERKPVRA